MCRYSDFSGFFGSNGALAIQLLTVASIAAGIMFWVWAYRKRGVGLRQYAIPIILWVVFGTLDITVTAKGTFEAPGNEGNPLARFIFLETGFFGPAVASVLWISLWSLLVLIINRKLKAPVSTFLSLAVFYSLGIGHVFGFSSWFAPTCAIAAWEDGFLPFIPEFLRLALFGAAVAACHMLISSSVWRMKGRARAGSEADSPAPRGSDGRGRAPSDGTHR